MIVSRIHQDTCYTTSQEVDGMIEEDFHGFKAYLPIDEIYIGRSEQCAIVIPYSYVSNEHASIYKVDEGYYIKDLNSLNGTFVNGQRITTHKLQIGDLIYIMSFRIVWMNEYLFCIDRDRYSIHLEKYAIPLSVQYSKTISSLSNEELVIDLELPVPFHTSKPTPILYTIGPALTMSITMLISILVSYLTSTNLSYSSMIITVGMLASMTFWPTFQRRNEGKRNLEEAKKREASYLSYLDSIQLKIQESLERKRTELLQSSKCRIGYTTKQIPIHFNYPKISYEMENDPLVLKMKEVIHHSYLVENIPKVLQFSSYHILLLSGKYKYEWLVYYLNELLDEKVPIQIEINELSFLKYDAFISNQPQLIITNYPNYLNSANQIVLEKCNADYTLEINDHHFFPAISENEFLRHNALYLSKHATILDLLKINTIDELNLSLFYSTCHTYDSLKVPLGFNISLDIHEKGNGPHGLLAGMTGSGKSELMITLVIMLCLHYSPEELSIVIIDYKGGGLSESFQYKGKRVPHLVNTINNLNQEDLVRGIYGLKNELKRRQLLFDEVKRELQLTRMDIDYYQKNCSYKYKPPLSHILIIVDEFAELKASNPEIIDELIHIARIGRSLGIHLLLSTQKPSGVVNQQIWSNTNYHICMKVADPSDSLEMLHSKDSSLLTKPGEFIVQYGSQSTLYRDSIIYLGNPSIQRTLTKDISLSISDGEHLISKIIEYCDTNHLYSQPVWLKPISDTALLPPYTIGLIDDYYHSRYTPFQIEEGKHYLLVGLSIEEKQRLQLLLEKMKGRYIEEDQESSASIFMLDYPFKSETDYHKLLNDSHTLFVMIDHTYSMRLSEYKYFDVRILFNFESEEYRNLFGKTMRNKEKKIRYKGLLELDEIVPLMLGGIE